ncbi:hypothetical protein CROQUDRAFT_99767, partial [Cronartium quercuum f. sp. fusiforme G11]
SRDGIDSTSSLLESIRLGSAHTKSSLVFVRGHVALGKTSSLLESIRLGSAHTKSSLVFVRGHVALMMI